MVKYPELFGGGGGGGGSKNTANYIILCSSYFKKLSGRLFYQKVEIVC